MPTGPVWPVARNFPTWLLNGNDALGHECPEDRWLVPIGPSAADSVTMMIAEPGLTRLASWRRICASQRLPFWSEPLCLAACDDSNDVVLIPLARTGTFVLQTVNGQVLPVTIADSISPPLRIDVLCRERLDHRRPTPSPSLRRSARRWPVPCHDADGVVHWDVHRRRE